MVRHHGTSTRVVTSADGPRVETAGPLASFCFVSDRRVRAKASVIGEGVSPRPTSYRPRLAVGALLVSGLLWGTTWIPLRHFAHAGLGEIPTTLLSYGAVGLVAFPLIWRERRAWWPERALFLGGSPRRRRGQFDLRQRRHDGRCRRVMLLLYLSPVWALLGGALFLGEQVSWSRALGVLMAITGAMMLLGGTRIFSSPPSTADILGLACGVLFAAQNVAFRAAQAVPLASKTLSVFATCALLTGALTVARHEGVPPLSPRLLLELVSFGAVWVGAAMWTTMVGVTHLEAVRSAVLLVFELVVAMFSAMWLGGERLGTLEAFGAVFILASALLEARAGGAATEPREA